LIQAAGQESIAEHLSLERIEGNKNRDFLCPDSPLDPVPYSFMEEIGEGGIEVADKDKPDGNIGPMGEN
jgi:hypothetical protein